MQPLMYTNGMTRVVWDKPISFEPQPQINKPCNGAHIQGMHRVLLTCLNSRTGMHCSAVNSQVKAEFTETCPLPAWCPAISSFQTGLDATPLNYMCLGVWAVTVPLVVFQCRLQQSECLQWHSSVGQFQLSFCRDVPVYPASIRWVTQWYPSVHWVIQWHSSVHWTSQSTQAQGKGKLACCSKVDLSLGPNLRNGVWGRCNRKSCTSDKHQGAVSIRKTVLPGMAIPMLKIRRPNGRLIFNMEIAIRR